MRYLIFCLIVFLYCFPTTPRHRLMKIKDKFITVQINVETEPTGALIEVNGFVIGKSPVTFPIKFSGADVVRAFEDVPPDKFIVRAIPISDSPNRTQYTQFKLLWADDILEQYVRNSGLPLSIYFNMFLAPIPEKYELELK